MKQIILFQLILTLSLSCQIKNLPTEYTVLISALSGAAKVIEIPHNTPTQFDYSLTSQEDSIAPWFKIVENPKHGTLTDCTYQKISFQCRYIPHNNFYGDDYILIKTGDGDVRSSKNIKVGFKVLMPQASISVVQSGMKRLNVLWVISNSDDMRYYNDSLMATNFNSFIEHFTSLHTQTPFDFTMSVTTPSAYMSTLMCFDENAEFMHFCNYLYLDFNEHNVQDLENSSSDFVQNFNASTDIWTLNEYVTGNQAPFISTYSVLNHNANAQWKQENDYFVVIYVSDEPEESFNISESSFYGQNLSASEWANELKNHSQNSVDKVLGIIDVDNDTNNRYQDLLAEFNSTPLDFDSSFDTILDDVINEKILQGPYDFRLNPEHIIDASSLIVKVNGQLMLAGQDYIYLNNTVSFYTAPANGANISFDYSYGY